jgi:hypothetical protein
MALTAEEIAAKELEITQKEQELLEKEKAFLERTAGTEDEKVKKAAQALVDEQLKDVKTKLDEAYAKRDAAQKALAEKEEKDREAAIQRMKDEGKHKEAHEAELADEKAKRVALERRNVELTRDIEVRSALSNPTGDSTPKVFRSENALEMAFKEIVGDLVKDETGIWRHKSGVSIRDYVKVFSENEANSFLFKSNTSSGAGNTGGKSTGGTSSGAVKSLFDLPQSEVLKMAAAGKFNRK